MKKLFYLISICTALAIAACDNSSTGNTVKTEDTTAFDLEIETAWVKKNVAKFSQAYKRGDFLGVASYYGGDVLIMPPNSPAITKKDVASMWGGAGVKEIKLNVDNVTGNRDTLVETGTYESLEKITSRLKKENM